MPTAYVVLTLLISSTGWNAYGILIILILLAMRLNAYGVLKLVHSYPLGLGLMPTAYLNVGNEYLSQIIPEGFNLVAHHLGANLLPQRG